MRFFAIVLGLVLSIQTASAFDCAGVTLPSSIIICSDPELMRIADERQQAVNEARGRLPEAQFKELMADQSAWVRAYATACGVSPDAGPPTLPVSPMIKACFKRSGEARTAYIRSYGGGVSVSPAGSPVQSTQDRLGPGFDCAKATAPLALVICADPELSRIDLAFNQAYWALYQDLEEADRQQLKQEDARFLETVVDRCGVPRAGGPAADAWPARDCVKQAYQQQRSEWIADLSGPALEEATRPLGTHVALERRLRQLGFLSAPLLPEGVYAAATRGAIAAWQQARGREPTGLLGNADAVVLESESPQTREAAIQPAEPRSPSPPSSSSPAKDASLGTAFAINNADAFLTNYHVVKGCGVIHARIAANREDGRVIASDERNDLAVIRIPGARVEPVRFREGRGIRPADGVVALGFPYAGLLASGPQVTAGAVSALAGLRDDSRYLQFTAPVQPGNSGGPLFDLGGNVVGVVSGRINDLAVAEATGSLPQNINFALKNSIVREFLDANRIPYLTASSEKKLEPADVGEAATKSTVLVGCSN